MSVYKWFSGPWTNQCDEESRVLVLAEKHVSKFFCFAREILSLGNGDYSYENEDPSRWNKTVQNESYVPARRRGYFGDYHLT